MKRHELMTPRDPHDCPHKVGPHKVGPHKVGTLNADSAETCWLCDGELPICRFCGALGLDLDLPCPGPTPPPDRVEFEPLTVPVVSLLAPELPQARSTKPRSVTSGRGDLASPGLLVSCALRLRHDFAHLNKEQQEAVLVDVRAILEEIMGQGFYSLDLEEGYAAMMAPGVYRHSQDIAVRGGER